MRRIRVIQTNEELEAEMLSDKRPRTEIQRILNERQAQAAALQNAYDIAPPTRPYQKTPD